MGEKVIDLKCEGEAQCHLMPCRIESNDLNVKAKEYFWPTIKVLEAGGDDEQGRKKPTTTSDKSQNTEQNPILTASFRGRPLQGRKIKLPDGYQGYIISKDERVLQRSFGEFTYWNWDEKPTNEDTVVKALQWINIAKAIHS